MNYLAGVALGSLLASPFRLVSKKRQPELQLEHRSIGRRRYRSPKIKWDINYIETLGDHLKGHGEVEEVTFNRVTGSLLIKYNCSEAYMDNLISNFKGVAEPCKIRRRLHVAVKDINSCVYKRTGGILDLPTSIAGLFLVFGMAKSIRLKQFPNGPQMLWWFYNLMKK